LKSGQAVLPFSNLSGDPARDYLADVLTEGLTTYLPRIRDAFVIALSTAIIYKGKAVDLRQVGRELGVRYALEGSEQHGGDRVRVSAKLIDVETGGRLWADQFDAPWTDLLQIQDEIVTRLARALQNELATVEAARISRVDPASPSAEDLALHGEAIFLRYDPSREESEAAHDLCERALTIDRHNVRALSILAERFATRVTGMQSTNRKLDIRRADELASMALALDPNSYHAHHAKARTLVAQKRADEAIIEAEQTEPSYRTIAQPSRGVAPVKTYSAALAGRQSERRQCFDVAHHADERGQIVSLRIPPYDMDLHHHSRGRSSAHSLDQISCAAHGI